ncbi:hypothetical protein [Atopobium fossor]|uniref:hypothetical protein n=1 Tax=Atopobium fossor TaxID=39487 RepID=UPI000483E237|nr:hypothetical protein [Atopobium fossor]
MMNSLSEHYAAENPYINSENYHGKCEKCKHYAKAYEMKGLESFGVCLLYADVDQCGYHINIDAVRGSDTCVEGEYK